MREREKKAHIQLFLFLLSYQHLQRDLTLARPSYYDALSVYLQMPVTSRRFQGRNRSITIFSKTAGIKGARGSTFAPERPLGIACKHYFTFYFKFLFIYFFGASVISKAQLKHVGSRGDLGS